MGYDLRDFVEDMKKADDLVEINDEVDWNFEIPAYDVISGRFGGPALLFNRIKDVPSGPRALAAPFVGTFYRPHRRIALALGIDPNLDRPTWYEELARRFSNMLRPVEVASGSCKEVVKMGKDANLFDFPLCYHAIGDGGRYIFLNATVIRDPDSDWINTGNYAIEVFSRNRLVITPYAHTNFVSIYNTKYQLKNEAMPVAVCLGGDPCVTMAAGMILPPGVTEYDVAGGIRGKPMELVKAETSNLLVPADAEVVIEGEIRPYERLPEGPKIEAFGFASGPRQPFYAMRVHCITHRKNPIIWDIHTSIGSSTNALHDGVGWMGPLGQYRMFGLPIKFGNTVSIPRTGATGCHAVIKKKYPEDYPGFMQDLFNRVMGLPGLGGVLAHNMFCDDDVNVLDYAEFYEAEFTQTNPYKDLIKTEPLPVMTIEASWMETWDRDKFAGPGTILARKMIYDATTKEEPPQGVRRLRFESLFPDKTQEWVVNNWQRLGFKEEARWFKTWIEAKY